MRRPVLRTGLAATALVALTFLLAPPSAFAEDLQATDWPCWRGPDHNGISKEAGWWPGKLTPLWKAEVGKGYSSFSVAAGRAYTMGNASGKDSVFCFDAASGKKIWSYSYECPLGAKFHAGGTNATPTYDEGRLYTVSKRGHLYCFDAASGKVIWNKNLRVPPPTWGYASSALIQGNMVLYNIGSAGLALDKKDGRIRWQNGTGKSGYATPVPMVMQGRKCLALFLKDSVAVVATANGQKAWSYPWKTRYDVNAADPIVKGSRMFISSGYDRGCTLIAFAYGKPQKVWENREMRNHFNSCVLIGDHLYGFDETTLKCLDWKTGRTAWSEGSLGKGALMAADGKLIIMADGRRTKGQLVIAEATPTAFKKLGSVEALTGSSKCWTTPVLSGGRIYCRNQAGHVACIAVKGK